MFDVNKIQNALYGVVGIRQPLNSDYAVLDADNISSRSNLFITSNPMVKVEYLYDNQDYKGLSDAEFNTQLANLQKDSIVSVAKSVFNKPDYIDRQVFYTNAQNKVNVESLEDGLVAYKINVSCEKNIAFEIKRVLLDFEGTGDIKLMLFNTSQLEPIEEKTITISSTHQEEVLDWKVDNSGGTYKGSYYLGYLTDSIGTLKPYKRDYNNSNILSDITYLNIEKVFFNGHSTETLPDLTLSEGLSECIGVNPDVTVYEDYTDLIIQNESLLAYAIYLDFQIRCIELNMSSMRSNENERHSRTNMLRAIAGDNTNGSVEGLRPQLNRKITSIRKELERLQEGYFGGRIMVDTLR